MTLLDIWIVKDPVVHTHINQCGFKRAWQKALFSCRCNVICLSLGYHGIDRGGVSHGGYNWEGLKLCQSGVFVAMETMFHKLM
jgi:hypothetical protein